MVDTRGSTLEFLGPTFDAAVQRAVDALLPSLNTRLTNEIRQNGTGGSGDQPPTIHTCDGDGLDDDDEGSGDEMAVVVEAGMDVMILVVVAGCGCRREGARCVV
ncbi:hypothetical protein Tco_1195346 [Tanacetum coccineum]